VGGDVFPLLPHLVRPVTDPYGRSTPLFLEGVLSDHITAPPSVSRFPFHLLVDMIASPRSYSPQFFDTVTDEEEISF